MKDGVWHKIGIVTLTLPLGLHRRNTVHDNIGNYVMLFLMPVDVVWSDLSWERLWFSFLSVFCLAELYTIVSLYVFKCSLYSCQSLICLQSTLWKKDFLQYYICERYVCVYTYVQEYTLCLHLCGPRELWRCLFPLQLLPINWLQF